MLELHGISKRFGPTQALLPTDLLIPSGKTTVLIGPSGCGKSTLLRIMLGLIWPDTGSLLLQGTRLTPANALALRRRGRGV